MKPLVVLFCSLLLSTHAAAQSRDWSFWSGMTMDEKEPDAAYQLETAGWNTRVYEWTPETAPHVTCIAQFADAGPVGMQCFPKVKNAE